MKFYNKEYFIYYLYNNAFISFHISLLLLSWQLRLVMFPFVYFHCLQIGIASLGVLAAPNGKRDGRGRPVDELLAVAGDMKHGRANPNGRKFNSSSITFYQKWAPILLVSINSSAFICIFFIGNPASGLKKNGGREEIVEYDILRPVPEVMESEGEFVPGVTDAKRGSGRKDPNRRGSRNRRNAVSSTSSHWSNGQVPYTFASNIGKWRVSTEK
jgi:hypothetical protein